MKFRTGDILIWRSTTFYDVLGENTILLPGLHSGMVLKGKDIEKLSICGKSPSGTYVTFLVDKIFPIEEVIGHIWHSPNGSSLHIIKRMSGRHISRKEVDRVCLDFLKLTGRPNFDTFYIAIAAYFRTGGLRPSTGYEDTRYKFCPATIAYFLDRFGFFHEEAIPNNLLPIDFYNCTFYQNVEYRRFDIFDKKTNQLDWFFLTPLIRWGFVEPTPCRCQFVEKILEKYDFPRIQHVNEVREPQLYRDIRNHNKI